MQNPRSALFLVLLSLVALWSASAHAQSASGASPNLTGLHIALDVGHNKAAGGAVSARGRFEFEFNQATARTIASVLRSAGAKVTIINESGDITSLPARPQRAASLGADAFLSIHHDSVNDKYLKTWDYQGTEQSYCDRFSGYSVFCSKDNWKAAQSQLLARQIGKAMLDAGFKPALHHNEPIPGENRPFIDATTGVYEYTKLIVAKSGKLPSALLECGVIVNRDEELTAQSEEYQRRIGVAVAKAFAAAREQGAFKRFRLLAPRQGQIK
jgi:N-acetylmuramoyl-L-alanine amidase